MSRPSLRFRAVLSLALSLVPLAAPALRLVPFALLATGGMLHAKPASAEDLYCGVSISPDGISTPIPCRLKPNTNYKQFPADRNCL